MWGEKRKGGESGEKGQDGRFLILLKTHPQLYRVVSSLIKGEKKGVAFDV